MKPTAQELWERIEEEMQYLYGDNDHQEDPWCVDFFQSIKDYAQAFAQEKVVEYEQKTYDIDTLRLISNETQNND